MTDTEGGVIGLRREPSYRELDCEEQQRAGNAVDELCSEVVPDNLNLGLQNGGMLNLGMQNGGMLNLGMRNAGDLDVGAGNTGDFIVGLFDTGVLDLGLEVTGSPAVGVGPLSL